MGKLLDMAIAGSKASGPTLTVNMTNNTGDGFTTVYKNGIIYTVLSSGTVNVPIVSGNTFYVTVSGSGGFNYWQYLINNTIITQGSSTGTVTSTTYTASGSNVYVMNCLADVP